MNRNYVPNVPLLVLAATGVWIRNLESQCTIIINVSNRVWSSELDFAVFTGRGLSNLDKVSDFELVRDASRILAFIVLGDTFLFTFTDVFPIGFKANVEKLVSSEDKLTGSSLVGGVYSGIDGVTHGSKDSFPTIGVGEFFLEVLFILDLEAS